MTFIKPNTVSLNQTITVSTSRSVTWADAYNVLALTSTAVLTFDISTATGTPQIPGFTFNFGFNSTTSSIILKSDDGTFTIDAPAILDYYKYTVETDGGRATIWINEQLFTNYIPLNAGGFDYESASMISPFTGISRFQRLPTKYFTVSAEINGTAGSGSPHIILPLAEFPSVAAAALLDAFNNSALSALATTATLGAVILPGGPVVSSELLPNSGSPALYCYFAGNTNVSNTYPINVIFSGFSAALSP